MARMKRINPPGAMDEVPHRDRLRIARKLLEARGALAPRHCWIWVGYADSKGYGQVWCNNRMQWAHRIAYVFGVGPIPHGMTVHHRCTNPRCVNPKHLELATVAENTAEGNRRRYTVRKPRPAPEPEPCDAPF